MPHLMSRYGLSDLTSFAFPSKSAVLQKRVYPFPCQQILGRFLVKAKSAVFSPFMLKMGALLGSNKYAPLVTFISFISSGLEGLVLWRSQGMCTWNPNHPCFSLKGLVFGGCQPPKNRTEWVPRICHIKSMFG